MTMDIIDAILLASGFSRRFGAQNKLLMPFCGKPLARLTLELVSSSDIFKTVFFVAHDEEVAFLADGLPVKVIRNMRSGLGQRESVRLGVEKSAEDYYAFFPCDKPLLSAPAVRRIVAERKAGCIVEPYTAEGPCNQAVFSAVFREELLTLAAGEHPRDIKLRHAEKIIPVEFDEPEMFRDVDSPAAFAELEKLRGKR